MGLTFSCQPHGAKSKSLCHPHGWDMYVSPMGCQRATKHRQLHGSHILSTPWGKNLTMKCSHRLGDQLFSAPWEYTKIVKGVIPMVVTFPSSPWVVRGRKNIVNCKAHIFCQPHGVRT